MRNLRRYDRWVLTISASAACIAVLNASQCSTDPESPAVTVTFDRQITGGTVYVTEPIDFTVSAHDDAGASVAVHATGLPAGASYSSATGAFSWRPAVEDTGSKSIVFSAGEGASDTTMTVTYAVVLPTLAAGEYVKVLRPVGGETFDFGDTISVAFVMSGCNRGADISVVNRIASSSVSCPYAWKSVNRPELDLDSTADSRGFVCRYFSHIDSPSINIGFYNMILRDSLTPDGYYAAYRASAVRAP